MEPARFAGDQCNNSPLWPETNHLTPAITSHTSIRIRGSMGNKPYNWPIEPFYEFWYKGQSEANTIASASNLSSIVNFAHSWWNRRTGRIAPSWKSCSFKKLQNIRTPPFAQRRRSNILPMRSMHLNHEASEIWPECYLAGHTPEHEIF